MPVPPAWQLRELRGRAVLLVGAGISGLASARALVELGARVVATNATEQQATELPDEVSVRPGLAEPPPGTALVVTSPGLRPDDVLLLAAARAGVEVIGEPELAWRWSPPGEVPGAPRWLVVTGTNGKTTTVGMLESILRAAGRDAVACGNIGYPVIDAVRAGHQELSVELSSFQLHWSAAIRPAAGCLLNIAEDHLDWHGDMPSYLAAKVKALAGAVAVAGVDDPMVAEALAGARAALRIGVTLSAPARGELGVLDQVLVDNAFSPEGPVPLLGVDEVVPDGPSGRLDALAAAALGRAAEVTPEQVGAGLRGFQLGPHRGGLVGEVGGVRYLDDSKATNPHAAEAALSGHLRVVWIAGGQLKGASVTEMILHHANRLVGVVLLGTDRAMFRDALLQHAPNVPVVEVPPGEHDPMTDAVNRAAAMAAPGDVVLLAPAAASLDQFPGWVARGQAFVAAVEALSAVPR
jgi:UDP-N-acetylmuramoylalanine--D-glutamate ligase